MLVITGHASVLLGHAMISVDLCRTCENTSLSPLPPKKIASHSPIFLPLNGSSVEKLTRVWVRASRTYIEKKRCSSITSAIRVARSHFLSGILLFNWKLSGLNIQEIWPWLWSQKVNLGIFSSQSHSLGVELK